MEKKRLKQLFDEQQKKGPVTPQMMAWLEAVVRLDVVQAEELAQNDMELTNLNFQIDTESRRGNQQINETTGKVAHLIGHFVADDLRDQLTAFLSASGQKGGEMPLSISTTLPKSMPDGVKEMLLGDFSSESDPFVRAMIHAGGVIGRGEILRVLSRDEAPLPTYAGNDVGGNLHTEESPDGGRFGLGITRVPGVGVLYTFPSVGTLPSGIAIIVYPPLSA